MDDLDGETETLLGSLDRQRRIVAWKCGGLDAAGLRARLAPSTLTLGGLLKHLADLEDDYFGIRLWGRAASPPFDAVDWENDPDHTFRSAADDPPEALYALWEAAVARARSEVAAALADGLDRRASGDFGDRPAPTLRRLIVDVIEDYARHAGHADLLREAVDGLVGEEPPA